MTAAAKTIVWGPTVIAEGFNQRSGWAMLYLSSLINSYNRAAKMAHIMSISHFMVEGITCKYISLLCLLIYPCKIKHTCHLMSSGWFPQHLQLAIHNFYLFRQFILLLVMFYCNYLWSFSPAPNLSPKVHLLTIFLSSVASIQHSTKKSSIKFLSR